MVEALSSHTKTSLSVRDYMIKTCLMLSATGGVSVCAGHATFVLVHSVSSLGRVCGDSVCVAYL